MPDLTDRELQALVDAAHQTFANLYGFKDLRSAHEKLVMEIQRRKQQHETLMQNENYRQLIGAEVAGNIRDGIVQSIDTARWEV